MKTNEDVYQTGTVKYMVNSKGHKVAAYKSNYVTKPKTWIQRNIRYPYDAILMWIGILSAIAILLISLSSCSLPLQCGDTIGSFNGVTAHYNSGDINSCEDERHISSDGYSYGFKWQCVEYIRRYYKDVFDHEMTRWGHASGYHEQDIKNGGFNETRQLTQYDNGMEMPQVHDIIVWRGKYGHVAIVTKVEDGYVHTIAQNVGEYCEARLELDGKTIAPGFNVAGFLRLEK